MTFRVTFSNVNCNVECVANKNDYLFPDNIIILLDQPKEVKIMAKDTSKRERHLSLSFYINTSKREIGPFFCFSI